MTFDESKVRREQGKFANKDAQREEAGQVDAFGDAGALAARDYWDGLSPDERRDFVDSRGPARDLVDPPDGLDKSSRSRYWSELDKMRSEVEPHEGTCYDCGGDMFTDSEGITTHLDESGNEDWEANADHVPVDDGDFERDRIQSMHRDTADVLEQYRGTELTYLNTGEFQSGRRLLGRASNGDRVYAEVNFRHDARPARTTDLVDVPESYGMSVTFSVIEKGRRDVSFSGRQLDDEHEAMVPDALKAVRDNHLNTLEAGTDKQMEHFREIQSRPDTTALNLYDRVFAEIEPERGYKFGSAWLYRPVDASVYRNACEALTTLKRG